MKTKLIQLFLIFTLAACGLAQAQGTKISAWPSGTTLTGTEVVIGDQGGVTVTFTAAQFKTYIQAGLQTSLTFGTGLTNTAGTVTVNTSQNIATLSNLTGNGFVKTSGGTGALSIDTTVYEPALGNPGSNGYILSSTTGGTRSWIAAPSGAVVWELEAANFTAVAGHKYQIDTSGGAVTVTLPATMTAMDRIEFEDLKLSWNTNNVTFARNGNKINGGTTNYTASVIGSKLSATAADTGATYGWSIK